MDKWNEKVDLTHFRINTVNSYADGWIEIPLGSDSVEGNGVTVYPSIEGVSEEDLKKKVSISMVSQNDYKIKFASNKETYDGFFALSNVNKKNKQLYMAYKYKKPENLFWFFTCNDEKLECIEDGLPGKIGQEFEFTTFGWSNKDHVLLYFIEKGRDGIMGRLYSRTGKGPYSNFLAAFYSLQERQISSILRSHNSINVAQRSTMNGKLVAQVYSGHIDETTLGLSQNYSEGLTINYYSSLNYYFQNFREISYNYIWNKIPADEFK